MELRASFLCTSLGRYDLVYSIYTLEDLTIHANNHLVVRCDKNVKTKRSEIPIHFNSMYDSEF